MFRIAWQVDIMMLKVDMEEVSLYPLSEFYSRIYYQIYGQHLWTYGMLTFIFQWEQTFDNTLGSFWNNNWGFQVLGFPIWFDSHR